VFSGKSTIFPLTHHTSPAVILLVYFERTTSFFYAGGRGEGKKNQPHLDSHTYLTCFFMLC